MTELVAQLPTEIWIHILQEAVKLVSYRSETKAFFPPPDDFTLISGFKGACSSFRSLAEETERLFKGQNMCVSDSGEILRSKEEDLVRIRHLAFKRKVTLADYLLFMPRCSKLESLYIYFAERSFGVLGPQTLLVSQSLVLLDLVYENMWWHAPTLALPNLRELRLSSQDPRRRLYEPVCVPLDSTSAERFAAGLVHTVRHLQRLRILSAHICLDMRPSDVVCTRLVHNRHFVRYDGTPSPRSFTTCARCVAYYNRQAPGNAELVRSREAKLSTMLAEKLPLLEEVRWMDSWNDTFYDELGMRESRIVRKEDGQILVDICGKIVQPLEPFSFDS